MSEKPTSDVPAASPSAETDKPAVETSLEASSSSTAPTQTPQTQTAEKPVAAAPADEMPPPPPPPRPASPRAQNQQTLQEAFPNIEASVIRAVLVASSGQLEPAFNALLSMSDPNAAVETPPPPPPRPTQQYRDPIEFATTTPQNQLESDAELAARLQEEYMGRARQQQQRYAGGQRGGQRPPQQPRRRYNADDDEYYLDDSDKDHSFFDDDLPVIKENLKKGFLETQNKFNSWISDIRKKIDGESPEPSPPGSARNSAQYGRGGSSRAQQPGYQGNRRSGDGYDADPTVLSDDFAHLGLRDGTSTPPARRQKANPDLFQNTATTGAGRSVSFDDRPTTINDEDLYSTNKEGRASSVHSPARVASPATGNSKWKPLKNVEPTPMDKDPFSLGDSDDEADGLKKENEPTPAKAASSVTGPQESGVTEKK